jgi:hypothetical protein
MRAIRDFHRAAVIPDQSAPDRGGGGIPAARTETVLPPSQWVPPELADILRKTRLADGLAWPGCRAAYWGDTSSGAIK